MTRTHRATMATALTLLAAFSFTACEGEVSVGGTKIDSGKLEKEIVKVYEAQVAGSKVDSVDCPSDQKAKKGGTFTCSFTTGTGAEGEATVTMADDKGTVNFDITKVPGDVGSAAIEEQITQDFGAQNPDDSVVSVDCPDALDLEAGTDCAIEMGSGTKVTATVSQDEDGSVTWSYAPAE